MFQGGRGHGGHPPAHDVHGQTAASAPTEPSPDAGSPVSLHRTRIRFRIVFGLREHVFARLNNKDLLARCSEGKTQNASENLHSVIWTSKNVNASVDSVKRVAAEPFTTREGS